MASHGFFPGGYGGTAPTVELYDRSSIYAGAAAFQ
jgi:hypothetical protein